MSRGPVLTFSIVICTNGRPETLDATLSSLLHLDYEAYEVCIVTGPTIDGTGEVIAQYGDRFKVASCAETNLSKSRNIGIAQSSGEIVAFIDDDAVPEPEWLTHLAQGYDHPEVGGVGGFVFDRTGVTFQARFVTADRLGRAHETRTPAAHELNFPFVKTYPHLLGTNASFRRTALLDIGGFDEEYEYFLDETDVCCRLIDRGYRIVQVDNAFVHHRFAPGSIRDERDTVRSWYPLIKNRVYFALRNGSFHHSFRECVQAGIDDIDRWSPAVEQASQPGGAYSRADKERFYAETAMALRDGIVRGLRPGRKLLPRELLDAQAKPFHKVVALQPRSGRRSICLISQDYGPGQNGGIARHIHQLATTLGETGHNVHVITKGVAHDTTAYENHVWVHRVVPTPTDLPATSPIPPHAIPSHIWNWSHAALRTVEAIDQRRPVDVVYAPLWDCQGIAFLLNRSFTLITSLHTTLRHWVESYPEQLNNRRWMKSLGSPIMAMEALLMKETHVVHANSAAIANDVERLYQIDLGDRVLLAPHGLQDWRRDFDALNVDDGCVHVLFVGRLERRKGIDVLLDIAPALLEEFPNVVLDVVGDDTIRNGDGSTYRSRFDDRVLPEAIRNRIHFHGHCDERRLRAFYANCDIFVAPSRYESFGLVALEAMMFCKPVVASLSGGLPEIVVEGVTGLLATPGCGESLRNALATLVRDATLRARMGAAGRARYEAEFTAKIMYEKFAPLLAALGSSADRAGVDSTLLDARLGARPPSCAGVPPQR